MSPKGIDVFLYAAVALFVFAIAIVLALSMANNAVPEQTVTPLPPIPDDITPVASPLPTFESGEGLLGAFRNTSQNLSAGWKGYVVGTVTGASPTPMPTAIPAPSSMPSNEYSTTNVQVEGVDEADTVKTDGEYIYMIAKGELIIARAYPASKAEILSSTALSNTGTSGYSTGEMFIDGDRLLVFGSSWGHLPRPIDAKVPDSTWGYWYGSGITSVKIYDISNREKPKLLRSFDFEGSYLTSRMIDDDVYFVINSYPCVSPLYDGITGEDIVPLYGENSGPYVPVASPAKIGYIPPVRAESFLTVAAISMADDDKEIAKKTIVGSGQSVYASEKSLYVVQSENPYFYSQYEDEYENQRTTIVKFNLYNGQVECAGTGQVKGHILNQFSMDEYGGYFRIATTIGEVWNTAKPSTNNVYVLDKGLSVVGSLEDLAPGEKIYSVRFMGQRAYVVTFKKVDPLFVIDLSDPTAPDVLGKLKIPGYSDYLHPYDDTHLIGIGKDAVDAGEGEISSRGLDFAWYQGIKMAIFDVSDVEHPKEMYRVTIGDRGTDSPVLTNHKAFLFDREKGLLVLPVTVAEIHGERTSADQYGEYVFQGAYVYDVDLEHGFRLRGKVTQYDSDDVYKKSGYYFYGDRSITRSLYIQDVLYTFSSSRLQLNDLNTLEKLKALDY
jgi:inhibitor of cysteine peptidase